MDSQRKKHRTQINIIGNGSGDITTDTTEIQRILSKYSHPSISAGYWFQDPPWIPKLMLAQVLYIKWHSIYVQSCMLYC